MATKYTFESSTTTTYEFHDKIIPSSHRRHNNNSSSSSSNNNNNNFHHQHHRRQTSKDSHDGDPTDGSGSLTYSAASSINSAGESTDSSFADILRVLDVQDSKELAAYLRKDGGGGGHHRKDEKSVAESLAYSMDAESCMKSMATDNESGLHGADLLSTFTGQASDQKFDGGAYYSSAGGAGGYGSGAPGVTDRDEPDLGGDDLNIFFSPAEHTDSLKRRKDRKRRERNEKMMNALANANGQQQQQQQAPGQQQQQQQQQLGSPKNLIQQPSNQQSSQQQQQQRSKAGISSSSSYSSGTNNSSSNGTNSRPYPQDAIRIESRQGTPPTSRPPKRSSGWNHMDMTAEDEDVWYAKWWMFCFPDAIKNMTEKR